MDLFAHLLIRAGSLFYYSANSRMAIFCNLHYETQALEYAIRIATINADDLTNKMAEGN